jgi:hypothetical protein
MLGAEVARISSMNTGHEEANALLIAAAPDLLQALQAVLDSPFFPACDCGLPECKTTQARAAIARALPQGAPDA